MGLTESEAAKFLGVLRGRDCPHKLKNPVFRRVGVPAHGLIPSQALLYARWYVFRY